MRGVEREAAKPRTNLLSWFWRNRASARLGFVLRTVAMVLSAAASLYWQRALVQALGSEVYGLLLTFLAVTQLGGLSDFGLGGGLGVRMLGYLARGEDERAKEFLSHARGLFILLSLSTAALFAAASPWSPRLLGFAEVPGSGSVTLLFALGALGVGLHVASVYFNNLTYVTGNVAAAILPPFLLTQLNLACQLLLARMHAPVWALYLVSVLTAMVGVSIVVAMLRASHPWVGNLRPVRIDWSEIRSLGATSFWVYLGSLGSLIYVTTDRILINAGFGPAAVPAYQFNYKLSEMAMMVLAGASYVAFPALVGRLLSSDPVQRAHGIEGTQRLRKLQTLVAVAATATYLGVNDAFIELWQGTEFRVPLALQIAFALNLTVTVAGDVGTHLLGRLDHSAIRYAGIILGGAGLLNFGLSFLAMKLGTLLGIACATVVAQSVASVSMGHATCRRLGISSAPWLFQSWLLPLAVAALLAWLRAVVPPVDMGSSVLFAAMAGLLLTGLAAGLGLRWEMGVHEVRRLRELIR